VPRIETLRLGSFYALGAFIGGSAFVLVFNYAPGDFLDPDRIGSILSWLAYAVGVAVLVAVPFTLALEWLRAVGRDVPSKLSWGALICGASFGSPVAVLTYPPVLKPPFLAALIISALVSALAAVMVTASGNTRNVDDG
jgi:hypothetical protein